MNFSMFPIAPMLLALVIPLVYCLRWKKETFRKTVVLFLISILIVLLYPITGIFNTSLGTGGYFIGKLILFTLIPLLTIIALERWTIKNAFVELGVHRKNIGKSLIFSVGALVITVCIAMIFFWGAPGITSAIWNIVMFFEAFNEEFFFRGILLLYLWKLTDIKIAYATSTLAFILAHSQYYVPTLVFGGLSGTIA
jgi:membrane protease YdiL (CAAX protease family)